MQLTNPTDHLWLDKWTAISGPLPLWQIESGPTKIVVLVRSSLLFESTSKALYGLSGQVDVSVSLYFVPCVLCFLPFVLYFPPFLPLFPLVCSQTGCLRSVHRSASSC